MDPNAAMEAAAESAKAFTKLQEIFQKMFNPHWTKKQVDADAYADERKLQTIRDNPDMEIVYRDGLLNARERSPEALAHRAEQRKLAESIRQEVNLENVLNITENELQQMINISDEPVDEDWLTRFFHIVEDVSSEDMQFVWGKILAGEIEQPGSFSYRTLETVKNLCKSEAEAFQKIAPLVLKDGSSRFLVTDSDILEKYNINFSVLSSLGECGLLNTDGFTYQNYEIGENTRRFLFTDKYMLMFCGDKTHKVELNVYHLTKAGRELLNIIECEPNSDYLFDVADFIWNDEKKREFCLKIYEIDQIADGAIKIRKSPLKEFSSQMVKP